MRPTSVTAAALLAFAAVAVVVHTGNAQQADRAVRRMYPRVTRGRAYRLARLTKTIAMPRHQVPVAALISYALRRAGVPGAHSVVVAGAIAMAADGILKKTLPRRRPRVYPGSHIDESFPSGHTTGTAALTLTLADVLERAGLVDAPYATAAAVLATLYIAATRLVLDEHWPSDVVAGGLLGFAISRGVGHTIGARRSR